MEEHEFVDLMRGIFRNLNSFRSLHEDFGISEITGPKGITINLYDIELLYSYRYRLSPRQREAIELFLFRDIREKDVAVMMGVSNTNPVAIYATQGLKKIYRMILAGEIPRFEDWVKPRERHG